MWSSIYDLWQQLELASEIESDLSDTVVWDRKWLVDFNAGNSQLVSFDRSNNAGTIDGKIESSVLEEKSSFRCWGCLSPLNCIISADSKKIVVLIHSVSYNCIKSCCHVWAGAPGCYWWATKMDMYDCWSFICCLSWNLGSLLKYSQLKSFL